MLGLLRSIRFQLAVNEPSGDLYGLECPSLGSTCEPIHHNMFGVAKWHSEKCNGSFS